MSVINQVLLELEKRRASGAERGALPDHVRALPESDSDPHVWWFAAAGGAAVALAGVIWLAPSGFGWPPRPTVATVPPSGPNTIVDRVVAASAVVAADVAPRDPAADDTGAAPRPAGRLSLELSNMPVPQRLAEGEPQPAKTREPIPSARVLARAEGADVSPVSTGESAAAAPSAPAVTPPPVRAAKEPAKPQAVAVVDKPAPAGKPGIEKQVHQPTARELSDNEYRKAAGSLHQGRPQEGLEGFRAALNLYPGHHGARQALVALLVESKAYAEAERTLQEGIKLAPEQIGFAMTLARLQVDHGDGPGAIATLQGSLAYAQGSPDYVAFLAALLQRQGRHDQAIEQFQAALRARPAAGVWWLGLAISLQAVNRGAEAQEAYRRAKTTNNLNPELTAFADQRLRQLQ